MFKLIYLYHNFHLNKISISFILISSLIIFFAIYSNTEIDINNLTDLRNFYSIKSNFISDTYNILEIIISMFVVILSFMELYNNSHLFDVVLIARNNKIKVLAAKLISYLSIIIFYNTFIFSIVFLIAVSLFQEVSLFNQIFNLYLYSITTSIFTLLLSLICLNLFRNYFASFTILLVVIIKRIALETEQDLLTKIIPYFNLTNYTITISNIQIVSYSVLLLIISFVIFKFKDIKT
ncbi:MAG: hypothetical protein R3Y05_01955 [bacterium]